MPPERRHRSIRFALADPPEHLGLFPCSLETRHVAREVVYYGCVDSTNARALEEGGDGVLYMAEEQTAGRGRLGRSWHSPAMKSLLFTLAFEKVLPGLGQAAALAVCEACRPEAELAVKWPNDVTHGGRKVCGVLLECRGGRTALGIGLNVNHTAEDFPPELAGQAVSLAMLAGGAEWDRAALLARLLKRLDERAMLLLSEGPGRTMSEWAEACCLRGKWISRDGVEGEVVDFDAQGALILRTPEGFTRLVSGELGAVGSA